MNCSFLAKASLQCYWGMVLQVYTKAESKSWKRVDDEEEDDGWLEECWNAAWMAGGMRRKETMEGHRRTPASLHTLYNTTTQPPPPPTHAQLRNPLLQDDPLSRLWPRGTASPVWSHCRLECYVLCYEASTFLLSLQPLLNARQSSCLSRFVRRTPHQLKSRLMSAKVRLQFHLHCVPLSNMLFDVLMFFCESSRCICTRWRFCTFVFFSHRTVLRPQENLFCLLMYSLFATDFVQFVPKTSEHEVHGHGGVYIFLVRLPVT